MDKYSINLRNCWELKEIPAVLKVNKTRLIKNKIIRRGKPASEDMTKKRWMKNDIVCQDCLL